MSVPPIKQVVWVGSAKRDLKDFPRELQGEIGQSLYLAQCGLKPQAAKPLKGFGGASVLEIVSDHKADAYRTIYTVRFGDIIYVLHAFQKKSKIGRATPKSELDLIETRLHQAKALHERRERERGRRVEVSTRYEMKRRTNVDEPGEAIEHEVSTGNIFADLGLPDADELLFKAQMVAGIQRRIEDAGWTQREAARRAGLAQPDLSNLLRGRLVGFSTDRLLKTLNRLGSDIEIRISVKARTPEAGHTSVVFG